MNNGGERGRERDRERDRERERERVERHLYDVHRVLQSHLHLRDIEVLRVDLRGHEGDVLLVQHFRCLYLVPLEKALLSFDANVRWLSYMMELISPATMFFS